MADAAIDTAAFDRLSAAAGQMLLAAVCASKTWIAAVLAGRPYETVDELEAKSDEALAALSWDDVAEALAAHPRIGERAAGMGAEAAWSRQEQSGAAGHDLRADNVAYEQRFGHVFLICATGLSGEAMTAALRARLGNDPDTERTVVRAELAKIVRLRLRKAFV